MKRRRKIYEKKEEKKRKPRQHVKSKYFQQKREKNYMAPQGIFRNSKTAPE